MKHKKFSDFFFQLVAHHLPADEQTPEKEETLSNTEFFLWLAIAALLVIGYAVLKGVTIS